MRDTVDYKHVVLGLIFLTYIWDAFGESHATVLDQWSQDRDEYIAENFFGVSTKAQPAHLWAQARRSA